MYLLACDLIDRSYSDEYTATVFNKKGLFKSGGFIHTGQDEEADAILEEDEEDSGNFIIPRGIYNNWVAVDIPTVVRKSL